jgi:hypothetical protein
MKEERFDEELKECTFKPTTVSLKTSKFEGGTCHVGSKKSLELYEYSKEAKSKKESLQASRSESDPECTFKPSINRSKPPKVPQVPALKQVEETLYRMHKGRQEYEEKQRFFERGEKLKSERRGSVKEQPAATPTLILDVSLGETVDRIVLYRGDEDKLKLIAKDFVAKNNLDEESRNKLEAMLKTELDHVLAKI